MSILEQFVSNLNIFACKKEWNTFTLTRVAACLGNPPLRTPTSVVVPPISITIASWTPDKKAAPRMEFVGPEANVKTGRCLVCSALDYSSNKNMFLWFVRFHHIFPNFINVKLNWLERRVRTKIYLQKNNITTFLAVTFSPVFLKFCHCSYYLISLVCVCVLFLPKFVDKW